LLPFCDGGKSACWVAAEAFEDAASAATGGGWIVGRPVLVPLTLKLSALRTRRATTDRLPETRTPAAPASTVPRGAIRLTSDGGESGVVSSAAMPAPVVAPASSGWTNRSGLIFTTTGGKFEEVFGP